MDKELNNYHIKNPDGADKTVCNNGKQSYLNDSPRFIKEDSVKGQSECNNSVSEGYFDSEKQQVGNADISAPDSGISSSSASASASSSAVSSSVASATSAIGGSVGALAGTVAASVMSAVIVVAAFVSTLTVNLSLVMATMYSLVFQLELSGAQEEDFATPIVAVLEGDNDVYREQEIHIDSVYITFDDLEPSTEYVITIKNEEKVFFKKSYFTASEQTEKGFVSARFENGEVIVSLTDVELKAGEYYTLTAKDDKGNVVFAKDDVEPNKEFTFGLNEPVDLYFALSVGGKTYAVSELKLRTAQYDYESGVWSWSQDYSSASITFSELHGGEPLTVAAEIAVSEVAPTCEDDRQFVYVATANCNGTQYKDVKTAVRENTALGHDYGEPEFIWEQDESGYRAVAIFVCRRDGKHLMTLPAMVRQDGDTFYTEVEYDREPYSGELPAEYDYNNPVWEWEIDYGTVSSDSATATVSFAEIHGGEAAVYNASVLPRIKTSATCDSPEVWYYQADTSELIQEIPNMPYYCEYSDEFTVGSPRHDYGNLIPAIAADCEHDGNIAYYYCSSCERYFDEYKNEIDESEIVIPAIGELVQLTTNNLSEDIIGKQVAIRTVSGSAYVLLGADGSMSADEYTIFYIDSISGTNGVILYYLDGDTKYYLSQEMGSIKFNSTEPTVIKIENGIYTMYDDGYVGEAYYLLHGTSSIYLTNGNMSGPDTAIAIYLLSAHNYGELIPENFDGNGLAAHYECSVCNKLFDENKVETTAEELALPEQDNQSGESVSLSLNDGAIGAIYIDPNGYARSRAGDKTLQDATAFVSSEDCRYIISGSRNDVDTLDIQNFSENNVKATFYITFDNATLIGDEDAWATAFRITGNSDIEIHIINYGTTTISAYNHCAIETQSGANVVIYVESQGGFDTFICNDYYLPDSANRIFGSADNCPPITFYMNGVEVDSSGNPK